MPLDGRQNTRIHARHLKRKKLAFTQCRVRLLHLGNDYFRVVNTHTFRKSIIHLKIRDRSPGNASSYSLNLQLQGEPVQTFLPYPRSNQSCRIQRPKLNTRFEEFYLQKRKDIPVHEDDDTLEIGDTTHQSLRFKGTIRLPCSILGTWSTSKVRDHLVFESIVSQIPVILPFLLLISCLPKWNATC